MSNQHQSLTTIPNRFAFIDCISDCAGDHDHLSLMLVDVVRFSDVTTSFGITVGDNFLLEIANRILVLFGQDGLVGRISGDVFGVVFPGEHSRNYMQTQFEKLIEHFKTPMYHEDYAFIADFKVGAIAKSTHEFNITNFVSQAEAALKQAKENKYESFHMLGMQDKAETGQYLALKADLKRALSENELELYYQPQVELNTLEIVGAECLLRWNHPTNGVVFPGPLIDAAESYNMMNELAYWTLEQAFNAQSKFVANGMDITVSVNISPTQLYDSKLVDSLASLQTKHQLDLSKFELELTEDVALSNSPMVKKQLNSLGRLGIAISIDDFGKGYSNLAYIRELDINALKVDKTFVIELTDNPVNKAIIEAAKLIGEAKQCDVIAEGVETIEQLHMLRDIGVKYGQGYLFSKAVPMASFMSFSRQEIIVGDSPLRLSRRGKVNL